MLKRKMESTFVITYLIVLISVNSVISTASRRRNLIYLSQWDVACFYRTSAVLHGGKSDDRTD
jgi:cbb3-type cytochrome oxidase subunit 1